MTQISFKSSRSHNIMALTYFSQTIHGYSIIQRNNTSTQLYNGELITTNSATVKGHIHVCSIHMYVHTMYVNAN